MQKAAGAGHPEAQNAVRAMTKLIFLKCESCGQVFTEEKLMKYAQGEPACSKDGVKKCGKKYFKEFL